MYSAWQLQEKSSETIIKVNVLIIRNIEERNVRTKMSLKQGKTTAKVRFPGNRDRR